VRRKIRIAGSRGIPANHGGFETFCERLSLGLHKEGWTVSVYCQELATGSLQIDSWNGIERIRIPISFRGPLSTIIFDWKCILHAAGNSDPILILGYNTAIFSALLRLKRIPIIFNMDGVEWARVKWTWYEKAWLFFNEIAASWIGNQLIADHPEIAIMLKKRVPEKKIVTIPYGATFVESADTHYLDPYRLQPNSYALLIARAEPENSILEIVKAYVKSNRSVPLVILGKYLPDENSYHDLVMEASNSQIRFLGKIFDSKIVASLRFHARLYIHGHQVGGTNPSLVESIAAGNPVLAHDNKFNRWCAGEDARYFNGEDSCSKILDEILDDDEALGRMRSGSKRRFKQSFQATDELQAYEQCLTQWLRE